MATSEPVPPLLGGAQRLNFLVIGAYKCGTTTLHHALAAHPDVYVPAVKEPSYLAFACGSDAEAPAAPRAVTDPGAYGRLFDRAGSRRAVGEVSPAYLPSAVACPRARALVPHARLVAVLRDPAERAYSDFLMYRRDGMEPHEDFGRALDEQEERAARHLPTGYYVTTGFYGRQLVPWFDAFGADAVHVELFEDLQRDPTGVLGRVSRHLGVEPVESVPLEHHNPSGEPANAAVAAALRARKALGPRLGKVVPGRARPALERLMQRGLRRPPLPPLQRARLQAVFAEDIAVLEGLIGRDLSAWRSSESAGVPE